MFSNTCKYGIRAVLYLAVHSNEQKRIGVKDIAKDLDLPQSFLAKVLQNLAKGNIISSVKGPGGGFFLNEENKENALIDIVNLLDGRESLTQCILGFPECSSDNPCSMHFQIISFRDSVVFHLRKTKIGNLVDRGILGFKDL